MDFPTSVRGWLTLATILGLLIPAWIAYPDCADADNRSSAADPIIRIAVAGDVGTGETPARTTALQMDCAGLRDPFDALVLLGDNVYPNGDPARLPATVFGPFGPMLATGTELLPVLGNHDVRAGNGPGQIEMLGMPAAWYSYDLGEVLFIGLDSNQVDEPAQTEWLVETLAKRDQTWVIIALHHPPFSAGAHGSSLDVRSAWVPLFETYGVDLVLAGHDHDYQRSNPIGGVTYVVSGAAARLRPVGSGAFTAVSVSELHFLDIGVFADRLEIAGVGRSAEIDRHSLFPEMQRRSTIGFPSG